MYIKTTKSRMMDMRFVIIDTGTYWGIEDPELRKWLVDLFVKYSWPL